MECLHQQKTEMKRTERETDENRDKNGIRKIIKYVRDN